MISDEIFFIYRVFTMASFLCFLTFSFFPKFFLLSILFILFIYCPRLFSYFHFHDSVSLCLSLVPCLGQYGIQTCFLLNHFLITGLLLALAIPLWFQLSLYLVFLLLNFIIWVNTSMLTVIEMFPSLSMFILLYSSLSRCTHFPLDINSLYPAAISLAAIMPCGLFSVGIFVSLFCWSLQFAVMCPILRQ